MAVLTPEAVSLPHRFTPRPYQLPFLAALDRGVTRAVLVAHRRSGKDKVCWNYTLKKTAQRIGTYYYILPTYRQAKKTIWEYRGSDGLLYLDHIPPAWLKDKNETDMRLEFANGSAVQLIGADAIEGAIGTNPVGCVFAEYSLQDPRAWDYMRPILRENKGWAIFNYTPRGKNHGYDMFQLASELQAHGDPHWYVERQSISDTGVLTEADMAEERREGMSEEMVQQEYYVSFAGVQQGSIFGVQLNTAETEGRVCGVPWQPDLGVSTWWDLGTGDATAIWFTQDVGREVHVIDYHEFSGGGPEQAAKDLRTGHREKYHYVKHTGPHDLRGRQFAANAKSTLQVAAEYGIKFEDPQNPLDKDSQLNAGRAMLGRCWFDREKTKRGRTALASYHFRWSEQRKMFEDHPYHDWSSHASDAWMLLGTRHKFAPKPKTKLESGSNAGRGGSGSWMGQ